MLALLILLGYLLGWIVFNHPPKGARFPARFDRLAARLDYYPQSMVHQVLSSMGELGSALCMILGVLAVGSEYGWETFKTMLTQRPTRLQTIAGRAVALAVITLICAIGLFAAAFVLSVVIVSIDGQPLQLPTVLSLLEGAGALWLMFYVWASFGMMLAYVFRQSAMAIGIGLVYLLLLETLLLRLLGIIGGAWVKDPTDVLPHSVMTSLAATFTGGYHAAGEVIAAPAVSATQAVVTLVLYAVAFNIVGAALFRNRDVT